MFYPFILINYKINEKMSKIFNVVGLMKAGKFPPQIDLLKKYGNKRNFNFQITNSGHTPVKVRMFGTLTDYVSANAAGSLSVTTEPVSVITNAQKKSAMNYYFQYPDIYETDNTFIADLIAYLQAGGDKVLDLPDQDFTTTPTGGLDAEITNTETFYDPETLYNWLSNGGFKKIPVTLGMLFSRGILGGLAQLSAFDYIDGTLSSKQVVTAISGGGQQQGDKPFVVDGNFAENLTAVSSGQPIRELWSHILDNGEIMMKALQLTAQDVAAVQQQVVLKEKSPFYVPGDVVFSLSKWQNPYVINAHMGLADNINMLIGKNNWLEFTVWPGVNAFSMFF